MCKFDRNGENRTPHHVQARLGRFRQDEGGAMYILAFVFFAIILAVAGLSLNVIRHEMWRSKMQAALDAGTLAAASLTQTDDRSDVVKDYMNKAGLSQYLTSVDVTSGLNGATVTAEAKGSIKQWFLNAPDINLDVKSTASQSVGKIEISLVLDVSGSMNDYNKIGKLRDAADDFVTQMFDATEPGNLTISVVPYAAQVTAGPWLLNEFKLTDTQPYSYCINFAQSDYDTTAMSSKEKFQQAGNFDPWYVSTAIDTAPLPSTWVTNQNWYIYNTTQYGGIRVCPKATSRYILPFSSDETAIKAAIDALTAQGNTSIDVGMKWGAALLDPSTQFVMNDLINAGNRPSTLSGRPAAFDDTSTMKVIVVMTDGSNTDRPVLGDDYLTGPSDVWSSQQDPNNFSLQGKQNGTGATKYYWTSDKQWHNSPYGSTSTNQPDLLTWPEVWEKMSVQWFLYNMVYPALGYNQMLTYWNDIVQWTVPQGQDVSGTQDNNLLKLCTEAKNENVTIYSIGFMADAAGKSVLEKCATTSSYYYDVQSLDIATAFNSIANSINKLRLTQ